MQTPSEQSFDASYARCVEQIEDALRQLGGRVDNTQVTQTAELIIQTMTGAWRFFHTPEHIFDVGRSGDAIEVLSALFHDAIHIQADNGVSVNVGLMVAPYIRETGKMLKIQPAAALPQDPVFAVVCALFDFVPGQLLQASKGQNEFLSAVVAVKCLEGALPLADLAQIAACIEATIPFRRTSDDDTDPSLHLHARLQRVNAQFQLGWDSAQIDQVVRRAVRLANRDVENFAHTSAAEFLNNTWNLMPETNHDLLGAYSYTVSGYRKSLQKMESFLSGLSPKVVFRQYHNEPADDVFAQMLARTTKNLQIAKLYLSSKLLSIAVIEAVSLRLGTEIPLATMMGELPQRGTPDAQLETFLPAVGQPVLPQTPLEMEVLALLETGRTQESNYDVKHSPVGTFVIKSIGFDRAQALLGQARLFFQGQRSGEEFLSACDGAIVEAIVTAVERVFEIRLRAIRR